MFQNCGVSTVIVHSRILCVLAKTTSPSSCDVGSGCDVGGSCGKRIIKACRSRREKFLILA